LTVCANLDPAAETSRYCQINNEQNHKSRTGHAARRAPIFASYSNQSWIPGALQRAQPVLQIADLTHSHLKELSNVDFPQQNDKQFNSLTP
jgi:hypothetical protein